MRDDEDDMWLAAPTHRGGWILTMYAVSFVLPAVDRGFGFGAFLASLLIPILWPMWAANPVLWYGFAKLFDQQWRPARNAGLLALALALSESWMFWDQVSVGYFLWIGSMLALMVVANCRGRPRAAGVGGPV